MSTFPAALAMGVIFIGKSDEQIIRREQKRELGGAWQVVLARDNCAGSGNALCRLKEK